MAFSLVQFFSQVRKTMIPVFAPRFLRCVVRCRLVADQGPRGRVAKCTKEGGHTGQIWYVADGVCWYITPLVWFLSLCLRHVCTCLATKRINLVAGLDRRQNRPMINKSRDKSKKPQPKPRWMSFKVRSLAGTMTRPDGSEKSDSGCASVHRQVGRSGDHTRQLRCRQKTVEASQSL